MLVDFFFPTLFAHLIFYLINNNNNNNDDDDKVFFSFESQENMKKYKKRLT